MKLKPIILTLFLWAALIIVIATPGCSAVKNAGATAHSAHTTVLNSADSIDQKVDQTTTQLNSASSSVHDAATQPGVPDLAKTDLSKAQSSIASAKTTVTSIKTDDTPAIRKATSVADAATAKLTSFYNEWKDAWLGPRTHAWIRGILFSLVGFGLVVTLIEVASEFSPFAFLAPVTTFVKSGLSLVSATIFTAGIPLIVKGFRWLWSEVTTFISSFRKSKATTNPSSSPPTPVVK